MSEFRVNSITNQDGSTGPQVCGVSTFSGKSGIQIPSGSTDFRRLDGGGRGRGVIGGGYVAPANVRTIDVIEIATSGNASDFGNLVQGNRADVRAASNETRGLVYGGNSGPSPVVRTNTISFTTIATTGSSVDFGDMTVPRTKPHRFYLSNKTCYG